MRITVIIALMLVVLMPAEAQTPADTAAPKSPWEHSLVGMANITQVSFKDWSQGGDNALSVVITLEGKSTRVGELIDWGNSYKFAFGQARLGSQPLRKTEDKIELESVLTYKLGAHIDPYASATLKSQFATGYKYDALGAKTDTLSGFFDPAYLTQAIGIGYQPIKEVKTRLGAALREILTSQFTKYADDSGTVEIEKTRVDGGLESVTDVQWGLMENILFTAKLEVFAPFRDFAKVVVRSDNTLAAKVNQYISVNLGLQLLHEPNISMRTQVKQTLAIGISYTFF